MFKDFINEPIDPIPEQYVNQLIRPKYEPDYSLTCLAIALLRPRIADFCGINGGYFVFHNLQDCVDNFAQIDDKVTVPSLYYYTYEKESKCDIEAQLPNYKEKKSVKAFVKDSVGFECTAMYHETNNIAAIFVNTMDLRVYHLAMTFLPLYFPAIFKEHPVKETEYTVIKSLSKKERYSFVSGIQSLVAPYIPEFRKIQLGSLIKQMHDVKIQSALTQVENQRATLRDLEDRITNAVVTLKQYIATYEGLKATEYYDDAENDLVDYLSANKHLHNVNIIGNELCFSVSTLLNNFNENAWDIFSNRGYIYDGNYKTTLLETFKSERNRRILLDHIFSESPDLMVKMAGNYILDMYKCRVNTERSYDYPRANPMYKSYVPNPHLKLFSCLGGYKERVMAALRDKNYIGAIELCIASAGSVDLDETDQTFRPFLGWILSSKEKILTTKSGEEMTPEEALLWLIDKEKDNETN